MRVLLLLLSACAGGPDLPGQPGTTGGDDSAPADPTWPCADDGEEVCDEVDNDCDDLKDEGCALVTDARWSLDEVMRYSCEGLDGALAVSRVETARVGLGFSFTFDGPEGSTSLLGDFGGGAFDGALTVRAACEHAWALDGQLLSPYDLEASLDLRFLDGACGDCEDQSFTLRGRR
ncbi:MAG: hypothetical protein H6741_31765 [Alphaproteobacteria bacterium]|nr:hypothetical protein [Alphaproteobacteria bacterium]